MAERSAHGRPGRSFWRHFIEMVVVMLLSMAIFGAVVSGVFALLGHGNLLHYPALRGLLMTGYMVIGMGLWMRHRQHGWASVREMSVAMVVPYVLLVGPFAAGLVEEGAFLGAMHVLMLPCMYVAMIRRREQYERGHPRLRTRVFARFNRSVANPVTRLFAGWVPPFALVRHRGRVSGSRYATPVWALATNDGLLFALLYGKGSDWAKNILAAGEVEVMRRGKTRGYAQPRLITKSDGLRLAPAIVRPLFRLLRVRQFLRVSACSPVRQDSPMVHIEGDVVINRPVQDVFEIDPVESPSARGSSEASIDLYWLPLGAGGWFVRLNGRIYEAIRARLERSRPLDLYHSALEVRVPEGRFVIENAWPIPDTHGASRGVVREGPVFSRRIARFRALRYEVRRWRDGVIPDAGEAVASPQRLSDDPRRARRLLGLVTSVPSPVWGRDELRTGEMWNSNSVVSWLLARSGLPAEAIRPPAGGRAPGWEAGLVMARRQQRIDDKGPHSTIGPRRAGRATSIA